MTSLDADPNRKAYSQWWDEWKMRLARLEVAGKQTPKQEEMRAQEIVSPTTPRGKTGFASPVDQR